MKFSNAIKTVLKIYQKCVKNSLWFGTSLKTQPTFALFYGQRILMMTKTHKWQTLENSQGDAKSIKNHLLSSTFSAGIYGPRVGQQPHETND